MIPYLEVPPLQMQQFSALHVMADEVLPVLPHLYGVEPERHLRGAPPQHSLPEGGWGAAPGLPPFAPALPLAAPLLAEELQAEQPFVVAFLLVGVGSGLQWRSALQYSGGEGGT